MGLVKITVQTNAVAVDSPSPDVRGDSNTADIIREFNQLTNGVGKLSDFKPMLDIDTRVKPVIQPHRRVPFHHVPSK